MDKDICFAGIHDIPMNDYINDPCEQPSLSTGVVGNLTSRSPLHAWQDHPRFGKQEDDSTARSDLGSAAHSMLLGGAEVHFVDAKDWRTKDAKAERDAIRAAGNIPMLSKDQTRLVAMLEAALPMLGQWAPGKAEQTLIWEENDVWHRSRPDWLVGNDHLVTVDYKTATSAEPNAWIRIMLKSGYDLQGALVLRGLNKLLGEAERDFLFLVQEIEPPYACSIIGIGPEMLELANRKINAAQRMWRRCLESDSWPGYAAKIHWADLPSHMTWEWESRDAAYCKEGDK